MIDLDTSFDAFVLILLGAVAVIWVWETWSPRGTPLVIGTRPIGVAAPPQGAPPLLTVYPDAVTFAPPTY